MKHLLFTAALLAATPSFAQTLTPSIGSAEEKALSNMKADITREIDERIAKLQEHRTCVSNAASADALKTCRIGMNEFRKEQQTERLERRKAKIENRLKKMKD